MERGSSSRPPINEKNPAQVTKKPKKKKPRQAYVRYLFQNSRFVRQGIVYDSPNRFGSSSEESSDESPRGGGAENDARSMINNNPLSPARNFNAALDG